MKYIYPSLSELDLGFVRLGGAGLANCMFVACRAYSYSKKYHAEMLRPTWEKLSLGPFLRHEKDKRFYQGLFNRSGITGLKKIGLILSRPFAEESLHAFEQAEKGVLKVSGLAGYFQDLDYQDSKEYLSSVVDESAYAGLKEEDFSGTIAVHIRLGDYPEARRAPVSWYKKQIERVLALNDSVRFSVFSDGTDAELEEVLSCPNTRRVFFGNALADIIAIGKSRLVIASDSTFSAWGAFLGQIPVIFPKRHFPPVFDAERDMEFILGEDMELPDPVKTLIAQM